MKQYPSTINETHTIYLLLFLSISVILPTKANATIYLYQMPDGSRVVTDRPKFDGIYPRLRSSNKIKGMGQLASGNYAIKDTHRNRKRYTPLITQMSTEYDVDVALVKAVVHAESYFDPNATSHKGATGLMQLMPKTALLYGIRDLYNPSKNLEAGVRHLEYLLKKYNHSMQNAIAAYNAGETAVTKYQGIPPYSETQRYVKRVLGFYAYYSHWP